MAGTQPGFVLAHVAGSLGRFTTRYNRSVSITSNPLMHFTLVPIAGNGTWLEGLLGLAAILSSALALSGYLGLRVSVLFNYDQNRD